MQARCPKCGGMLLSEEDMEIACFACGRRLYLQPTGHLRIPPSVESDRAAYKAGIRERDKAIRDLYSSGASLASIAKEYGLTMDTASYIVTKRESL